MEALMFSFSSQQILCANVDPAQQPGWNVTLRTKKVKCGNS